jgi:hypothetical protein
MHNLKSSGLITPNGPGMPLVSSLSLAFAIFENDIGCFKNSYGERMGPIFTNGLEESRKKGGTDYLEFKGFRVSDFDGDSVIIVSIEPFEVFLMGTLHSGMRTLQSGEAISYQN